MQTFWHWCRDANILTFVYVPTRKKLRRQNKNIQNRKQETKERLQQIRNIKRFPIIPNRRLQLRANTNPQKGSLINSTVL
ncbi:hypothetical protein HanHA300_Chr06g0216761 [Helianthus annuus]|nr:hypothetical protein HanHA300_Chr06g0216761 [Helianthus annuus]KAJ0567382.1 hypothetical protein HanIR_Chr06g0284181 [Helianthus annuus]KAJ0573947.1 hypothetical protein HanHA89_Chr06g0232561 [Helianthus annuus]KAJ0738282.1 hypothetical protein HanLR1_Chr06g0216491 [Helianthus annuus]KAJ0741173.1 hypothetical protein HanOQP8_Chr06g0225041 [Helianthus annuus]